MIKKLIEIPDLHEEDIGVITSCRQQVLKIMKALEALELDGIKVGSVEQFQGQERRVIIISTVRSTVKHNEHGFRHCLGFFTNPRRFNVAVTRAKSLLITNDVHWEMFLSYCMENGSYTGCTFTPTISDVCDDQRTNNIGSRVPNGSFVEELKWQDSDRISQNATGSDEWESTSTSILSEEGNFCQKTCTAEDNFSLCGQQLGLEEKSGMSHVPTMHNLKEIECSEKSEDTRLLDTNAHGGGNDSSMQPLDVNIPEPCFDESKWEDGWT